MHTPCRSTRRRRHHQDRPSGPLTGAFAAEGEWAQQSVEIAAQLINDKGGVLGQNVEIVVVDDASNPKDSALAAQKLISQGLQEVIASYGSSVTAPRPTCTMPTKSFRWDMGVPLSV